jgi:cytochrome P450
MTEALRDSHPVDVDYELHDPTIADDYNGFVNNLRETCPRGWSSGRWSETRTGFWFYTTYSDTTTAANNWQVFSNTGGSSPMEMGGGALKLLPLDSDPPLHGKIRRTLNPFFTPTAARASEPAIRTLCGELLDQVIGEGRIEFMAKFAIPLPARVLFEIFLGEDPEEIAWMLPLIEGLFDHPEEAAKHAPPMFQWVAGVLEGRRQAGRTDDVMGVIAHAGNEPDYQLTELERLQIAFLVVLAGMETTASALGCIAHRLAADQELRERLREMDEQRLENAIDEFLRIDPPVPANARTITSDSTFQGCPMLEGERAILNWAGANHDPAHYSNPDVLDFDRDAGDHLSFGHGRHRCLGSHLAKRELKVAIEEFCKLRRFELAPGADVRYRLGGGRAPATLPLIIER